MKATIHARLGCLALLASMAVEAIAAAEPPLPADSVYHVDAVLTGIGGDAIDWRTLRGKPRVVTMFYSTCRAVCR